MTEMPMNLQSLEMALLDERLADVRAFFAAADVASGNDALIEVGREYGFPTFIVDAAPFNGQAIMLGRDLAKLMYDTSNTTSIGQLLRRYGFDLLRITGSMYDTRSLLTAFFHLSRFNTKATFATWQHLLIVGMYGQTTAARNVKAYLLQREKASRVADKVEESTGMSPRQVVAESTGDLMVRMAQAYRDLESRSTVHDQELAHQHTQLLAQQQQLLAMQSQTIEALERSKGADGKATMALEDGGRMTMEEFIYSNGLATKFPIQALYKSYAKWVREFCYAHNLKIPDKPVYGKDWDVENGYPIQALIAWLKHEERKPWQMRLVEERKHRPGHTDAS